MAPSAPFLHYTCHLDMLWTCFAFFTVTHARLGTLTRTVFSCHVFSWTLRHFDSLTLLKFQQLCTCTTYTLHFYKLTLCHVDHLGPYTFTFLHFTFTLLLFRAFVLAMRCLRFVFVSAFAFLGLWASVLFLSCTQEH